MCGLQTGTRRTVSLAHNFRIGTRTAACREHSELSWVDTESGRSVQSAKAVCVGCLVNEECLGVALADPTLVGIWGGTTSRERNALRRNSAEAQVSAEPPREKKSRTATDRRISPIPLQRRPPFHRKETPRQMTANNSQPDETPDSDRSERVRASRAVLRYLDGLSGQPRRSTRTVESEIAKVDRRLAQPGLSSAKRLKLLQQRRDLEVYGLAPWGQRRTNNDALDGFITYAAVYAQIHGISYEAFREFGVSPEVLTEANITTTRRSESSLKTEKSTAKWHRAVESVEPLNGSATG